VTPSSLEVRGTQDPANAIATAARQRLDAMIVLDCTRLHSRSAQIVDLAATHRLPALYPYSSIRGGRAHQLRPRPARRRASRGGLRRQDLEGRQAG
jgi:hypothetical protein